MEIDSETDHVALNFSRPYFDLSIITMNLSNSINEIVRSTEKGEIPEFLKRPYEYLERIPSNNQNIRAQFIDAFNELFYHIQNEDALKTISEIISIFHNASLLIDDIEDDSKLRRGHQAAHLKYGLPLTINSGNLMYFVALRKAEIELPEVVTDNDTSKETLRNEVLRVLMEEMIELHCGQGLDIYWRDELLTIRDNLPDMDSYFKMVMNKTGGLFRLSIRLMNLCSAGSLLHLIPLANLLGILYQVRDDYLNLVDRRYSENKGVIAEDLVEGKLSVPILHCLRRHKVSPVTHLLFDIRSTEERKMHSEILEECISYMKEKSMSLEFTRSLIQQLKSLIFHELLALLPKEQIEESKLFKIINRLCDI